MRKPRSTLVATLESLQSSRRYGGLVATHEAISFQRNDPVGPALEAVCVKFIDLVKQGFKPKALAAQTKLIDEIQSIIKRRFGIQVVLIVDSYNAAVLPNYYLPTNTMLADAGKGKLTKNPNVVTGHKEILELSSKNLGTVNADKAMVTGWFSEQVSPLCINFYKLYIEEGATAANIVASILHEVGHIFDAIMFLNRTHTANHVIADVARYIGSKRKDADVNYIYNEIKKIDSEATHDMAAALASGDTVVMGVTTQRLMVGAVNSLMSDRTYDRVQNEALADSFAVRFGYGDQLVLALERGESRWKESDEERARASFMLTGTTKAIIAFVSSGFLLLSGAIISGGISLLIGAIVTKLISNHVGIINQAKIYDDIKTRYLRIRQNLVNVIKDQSLDKELRTQILEQLTTIDTVIQRKETFTFFLDDVANLLSPSNRRAAKSIETQQKIEALIANELFVKASQLKVIAEK